MSNPPSDDILPHPDHAKAIPGLFPQNPPPQMGFSSIES